MPDEVYKLLCETMAKRGGAFPGMDIPEFYELVAELFTPEEAEVFNTLPRGLNPVGPIAAAPSRTPPAPRPRSPQHWAKKRMQWRRFWSKWPTRGWYSV